MKSWHDYQVYGYEVKSIEREIRFTLAWPREGKEPELKIAIFKNVFGYELKNDSMVSIVCAFEEIPLAQFFQDYGDDIRESYRQNGAYGNWAHDLDNALEVLGVKKVKAIEIYSSIGLVGWILAQSIEERNA